MVKKIEIAVILILIASVVIGLNMSFCYGATIINENEFDTTYKPSTPSEADKSRLYEIASLVMGAIQVIGGVVAVAMIMIIGIKGMLGSAEQKANYKKSLPVYILGLIMVVSITLIPTIIIKVVENW